MKDFDIEKIDQSDYYAVLVDFDRQLAEAKQIAEKALTALNFKPEEFRHIVITGMGGSAIAGDFVRSMFLEDSSIPILVSRDYELPGFVGNHSLVIVSSYSGNTEETISAFRFAALKGAKIISISTGGTIADLAVKNSSLHIHIPSGLQPRQAIGFSLVVLFGVISRILNYSGFAADVNEAMQWIEKKKNSFAELAESNRLIQLARQFSRVPAAVYSSEKMFPAANRLKGQICENAKLLAFANAIPEMNHNEIVGWDTIDRNSPNHFGVIFLRDAHDHTQTQRRFEILKSILEKKTHTAELWSEGTSPFTRYLSLIYIGDWLSFYLAILRKQNPTPVNIIEELKTELSKS